MIYRYVIRPQTTWVLLQQSEGVDCVAQEQVGRFDAPKHARAVAKAMIASTGGVLDDESVPLAQLDRAPDSYAWAREGMAKKRKGKGCK